MIMFWSKKELEWSLCSGTGCCLIMLADASLHHTYNMVLIIIVVINLIVTVTIIIVIFICRGSVAECLVAMLDEFSLSCLYKQYPIPETRRSSAETT